jgi:cysteine desulfurase
VIYLDLAATSPVRREVLEAMWPFLTHDFGNPASHHEVGASARRALGEARARVARSLGARAGELTFCSGGTESVNTAIKGIALAEPRGRHVVVSAVEHPAVLESAAWLGRLGYDIATLPVDADGLVDPGALEAALRDDTTLVSIQHANNEVGTVQPIAELAAAAAARGVPFHTDAVQAAGWVAPDALGPGVTALSISGHKLGTPKGVGLLWIDRRQRWEPLVHGGGQQGGRRSGTEDVAGAVGLATALELGHGDPALVAARRDRFIAQVEQRVPGALLTGHREHRLPGHASFVLTGSRRSGESLLVDLDARGIVTSSGSACAAGSDEPSHVLTAMGVDRETAQTAIRFTFDGTVDDAQLADAVAALEQVTGG